MAGPVRQVIWVGDAGFLGRRRGFLGPVRQVIWAGEAGIMGPRGRFLVLVTLEEEPCLPFVTLSDGIETACPCQGPHTRIRKRPGPHGPGRVNNMALSAPSAARWVAT